MKKLSIILLALALALAFTVPAMAIHIADEDGYESGTIGITGRYQFDGEFRDVDGSKEDFFDDDLDLGITMTLGDVVGFIGLEATDRIFEGSSGGSRDSKDGAGDSNTKVAAVDNYHVTWTAMDNLKLKIGEYGCAFARAIGTDGACDSNIQVTYMMDALDISAVLVKNDDGSNDGAGEDDDDTLAVFLDVNEAGPFTTASFAYYGEMNDIDTDEDSYIGVDLGVPVGPVALGLEYGANGGDLDGNFFLLEIGLSDLLPFNLNVNYYMSSDDYTAAFRGNDFSPVIILGDNINEEMLDMTVAWVDVTYDVNDKLRVGFQVAGLAENDAGEEYGTEVNVGLRYNFADNVVYKAALGMYSEGDGTLSDDVDTDEYWHRLELKF